MELTVNGEPVVTDAASINEYLESAGIDPRHVAVELNLEIVPKSGYGTIKLKSGDQIEIVHFVGGG